MPAVPWPPRLLFVSYHNTLDPGSGAAIATADLLRTLRRRGWDCRVLCGPQLDSERPESLEQILADVGFHGTPRRCTSGPVPFTLWSGEVAGLPVTVYAPAWSRAVVPAGAEGLPFLAVLNEIVERFRPHLALTYGGHWLAAESIACLKRHGVPVVFALHNLAYTDPAFFRGVDAIVVPSRFARHHYRRLGLECVCLPHVLDPARCVCEQVEGRYVTFVNPQPAKGALVFARLAEELGRRRPDIPLLVVEGRGQAGWLRHSGVDLRRWGNVAVMNCTPDPRDYYRLSRVVVMPSVVPETFGLVAAEAISNGIVVVASRRGALPEVVGGAGVLVDLPPGCTPQWMPRAAEVAEWVAAVVRLWDEPEVVAAYRRRVGRWPRPGRRAGGTAVRGVFRGAAGPPGLKKILAVAS